MRKKLILFMIIVCSIFALTSCDDVKALMELVPKFDGNLPNNIAGKYAYFASEVDKEAGTYTTLFSFDSKEDTFTESFEGGAKSGKYIVDYKTYAITECNGTITLKYDDGNIESHQFYFLASAINGPEYIIIDKKQYYYWGN